MCKAGLTVLSPVVVPLSYRRRPIEGNAKSGADARGGTYHDADSGLTALIRLPRLAPS
jgi:hypothetical protein